MICELMSKFLFVTNRNRLVALGRPALAAQLSTAPDEREAEVDPVIRPLVTTCCKPECTLLAVLLYLAGN